MADAVDETGKWQRSSFCSDGACVEVAEDGDRILMRDSKDTSRPFLAFDHAAWAHFIADIESGSLKP